MNIHTDERPTASELASEGIGGHIVPEDAAARLSLWGAITPQDEPPF